MNLPIDLGVLKLLSTKELYDEYVSIVMPRCFETEIQIILQSYAKYYKTNDVIDFPIFASWFFHTALPDLAESKKEIYTAIFSRLETLKIEDVNTLLLDLHEKSTSQKLMQTLQDGFNLDFIKQTLQNHENLISKSADVDYITNDLKHILEATDRSKGMQWRLNCLNESIGPVSKGMLIIVAAYVDVGKTMFAISEASYMAKQLANDDKILWLNNEEDNVRVQRKLWKAVLGCDDLTLQAQPDQCQREYIKRMNGDLDRIIFVDIRSKSLSQIIKLFQKYNPKLAIIDQVDKIATKTKTFSDHDRLKNLYGEIRNLANSVCPILAISQADVSTTWTDRETGKVEYKLYPHHRQLDGSKVGKPGEADVIIMIGRRADCENTRGINVSKNKFGPTKIQEVLFKPEVAQYRNP